jgi:glutathione synthase
MSAKAAPGVEPAEAEPGAAAAAAAGRKQQQAVLLAEMVEDAAVWCAVHGLVVGDRADPVLPLAATLPPFASSLPLQRLLFAGLFFPVPNQLANACFFRRLQRSGTVPGVGLVHAPFSLLPARLPESFWKQACELAPIFNELVDRVSLDGEFLQAALSRQVLNYYTELFRQPCICLFSA